MCFLSTCLLFLSPCHWDIVSLPSHREKGFRLSSNRCFSLKTCYVLKLVRWHLGPEFKRKKKKERIIFLFYLILSLLWLQRWWKMHMNTVICLIRIEPAALSYVHPIFFSVFIHNPCLKSVLYTGVLVCIRFVPILRAQRIAVCVCWGSGIKQGC